MKKLMTLCIIYDDARVLLGIKKRGFGVGKWNGFGGKVRMEAGEAIETAARRELAEEVGVVPEELRSRGVLRFHTNDDPTVIEVHIFSVHSFNGEPVESEEMRPQWFPLDAIPYDEMSVADSYWLPLFLEGKCIEGEFYFDKILDSLVDYEINTVVQNS